MRRLLWAIPFAAFFLNPGLACGPSAPGYGYDAEDLRFAVAGTWMLGFTPDGGETINVTLSVDQAAGAPDGGTASLPRLVRAANACGTRTLTRPAAACIDLTDMPLEVKILTGGAALANEKLSGNFRVASLQFISGDLDLWLGPYHVTALVSQFGTISAARLSAPGPSGSLTVIARKP
jgi:hypothetical protein